jgi:hypothetical protein
MHYFLKIKTTETIQKTTILEETFYEINHDYDRFIISKKAMPFRRNGILEINMFLKTIEIDEHNSKIDYTIKYSAISNLLLVAFHLIIISVTMIASELRFFGESIVITSYLSKFIILATALTFIDFYLWLCLKNSESRYIEIIEELIKHLQKSDA